jgi:hypothetical protein
MSETIIEDRQSGGEDVSTADLQRMLDEARNRETELQRERDDALGRVRHVERERDSAAESVLGEAERRYSAETSAVTSALTAAQSDADRAEEAYVRAMESNDWAAAGKAQRAMSEAAARHTNLNSKKEFLEANKDRLIRSSEPPKATPRESSGGDKYQQVVGDLHPAERRWLDARPNFLTDTKYRAKIIGASQIAAAEHERGTPEYFREIERVIGETGDGATEAPPARRADRNASADVAPQRRASPGTAPQGSREIRLTADQAEVADSLYGNSSSPDYIADQGERYKKYAANLERMRASGRM